MNAAPTGGDHHSRSQGLKETAIKSEAMETARGTLNPATTAKRFFSSPTSISGTLRYQVTAMSSPAAPIRLLKPWRCIR